MVSYKNGLFLLGSRSVQDVTMFKFGFMSESVHVLCFMCIRRYFTTKTILMHRTELLKYLLAHADA